MLVAGAAIAFGADLFIGAAVYFAGLLKVPPVLIGASVVSLGTSLPEMSVTVSAARKGYRQYRPGQCPGLVHHQHRPDHRRLGPGPAAENDPGSGCPCCWASCSWPACCSWSSSGAPGASAGGREPSCSRSTPPTRRCSFLPWPEETLRCCLTNESRLDIIHSGSC